VLDRAVLGHIFLKVLKFSFIIYHYQCSVFTFIHIPSTVYSLNTDISALVWTFLKKYGYLRLVEAKICKCKSGVDSISISKVLKCMWFVSFCQYKIQKKLILSAACTCKVCGTMFINLNRRGFKLCV